MFGRWKSPLRKLSWCWLCQKGSGHNWLSLRSCFLYIFDMLAAPKFMLSPLLIMLIVISSYICQAIMGHYELDDPGWIVIDEFLGMLLGYLIFPSRSVLALILFFGLFRFFDILKPYPISLADKIKSGFGIIFDDLIAGFFAGLILLSLNHFKILV